MPKVRDLSPEDLLRWRMASADKELVEQSHPGLSVDEARRAMLNYYKILGDILADYQIEHDNLSVYVSPFDGGIYRVDSL